MPTITKIFTMQEASQHSSKDDCWIVVDGKVYDVSSYLDEHPGGDDVVLAATGKDATDDFEDAGHSREARELLETFCIGELDNSSSTAIPELEISSKTSSENYGQKLLDLSKQYWAVPVAVIGISVVVGFIVLRKK
ncbi:cytochrome b5 [Punica granatum]|uniref:Cytochrome b5 n=1 Tax=Punica granatum TaxID=22663 RepID=A0A6P8DB50_PUNGR|nr:cytochrome b5 [Punica granatum]